MEEQKSQAPHSFDHTIPEGVTEIAEGGFRGQIGIKSINIPGSFKRVGHWAFAYCKNLKHVTLHEGLGVIGGYAFYRSGLESINIPRSVKSIGKYAFDGCKNLKHVTLHEGLEVIGDYAFVGSGLESINIPGSVKRIGDDAFSECKNLKNIIVEEDDVKRVKAFLPDEHKDKVILRKHYEKAQGMIKNIKVNEYTASVRDLTELPDVLVNMVGSYLNDEAYARMQAVRIPRTDDAKDWGEYSEALNNAATNSTSSSSSSGGGDEGPGKDGPNFRR